MIKFEIGQRFWDECNCLEIEVVNFNGFDYFCTVLEPDNIVDYQWFTVSELARYRRL